MTELVNGRSKDFCRRWRYEHEVSSVKKATFIEKVIPDSLSVDNISAELARKYWRKSREYIEVWRQTGTTICNSDTRRKALAKARGTASHQKARDSDIFPERN